jgi:uncharacterized protein (DUF58 family)
VISSAPTASRALAVTLAGALLTLVAFMFAASPLFVPGIAFLVIGLAAPAWVWCSAQGARVVRALPGGRVVEDEPLEATIEVRRGYLGLPGAEVIDPVTGARVSLSEPLSLIAGGRVARVRVVTSFSRRGIQKLDPPTLVVSDALQLARTVRIGAESAQELLVLPRTERVRWLVPGSSRRSERTEGNAHTDALAAVDLDGLRPYRPGTPASRIHWPAVARGAGLLERRLQPDGDTRPLVVLDTRDDGQTDLLDAAVRAAASLVIELARTGGCRLLLSGERRAAAIDSDLANWPAVHARLALVEGGPSSRAPALGASGSRVGPVLYVASQPFERLTARVGSLTHGVAVVVLPAATLDGGRVPGSRIPMSASFEVSGCVGFTLRERGQRRRATPGVVAA